MNEFPLITVVMPVRNEGSFLADTIGRLLAQDYPSDRFEIIVADGMSDDGTRDIVARIAASEARVRLLDNPKRRSSAGRNIGFRAGHGDVFVIVDGHCHIPDRYFLRSVAECFATSGADCLGRPQPLNPPGLTPFQQSVALARASRLGHGGDSLIYGDYEGFASPVSNGAAYRREVFDRVGFVDEDFDACEDVEFNYRVEQAGFTAYTSPKLTVRYYPRQNFPALFNQMRRYGRGRIRFYRKHPSALTLLSLVPACFAFGATTFVALMVLNLVFGLSDFPTFVFNALGLVFLAYTALVCIVTIRICREKGLGHAFRLPFIFPTVHVGFGLGMWEAIFFHVGQCIIRCRRVDGPIRIVFLIDAIHSITGGTERQLLLVLEGLDRQKFEPCLCVLRETPALLRHFSFCPVHVLGIGSLQRPSSWWKILLFARWLLRKKIDILQTHFTDSSLIGGIAAAMARTPVVVATRKSQCHWVTTSHRMVGFLVNRLVTHFVANSEATRQWTHRFEGIALDRISVIHNGLALRVAQSQDARSSAKALLGISPGTPVVGIVANLRPVKRIDVFLRAASVIREDCPEVHFVVIGEGGEEGRLKALAHELGLDARGHFLGRRDDVAELLPGFDVGVLSSDSESFSNSVVEYMAAGLPVAATDVGGCREALDGSSAVILVPPGDAHALGLAMKRLLLDPAMQGTARTEHRRRAEERFSHVAYIKRYEELYVKLFDCS